MADVFSKRKRSSVMAAIRSTNTNPERIVRRVLRSLRVPYQQDVNNLPGRPDIVVPTCRTILQIKGCFWHGHHCLRGRVPKQNKTYWMPKIAGNVARDHRNERRLRSHGWSVKTIWECRIRRSSAMELAILVRRLVDARRHRVHVLLPKASQLMRIDRALASLRSRRRG